MNESKNYSMPMAIIFAAIVISGSLFYLGYNMQNSSSAPAEIDASMLQEEIEKGIENFIKAQEEEQRKAMESEKAATEEKAKNVKRLSENDHYRGNKDAPITLIEYSDFECPYCKKFHQSVIEATEKSDQFNWIYRHFPLKFHEPKATNKAMASECAADLGGNDKFWAMADLLNQKTMSAGANEEDFYKELAAEIGIDAAKFTECYTSSKFKEKIANDLQSGIDVGITGTPGSILINNKTGEVKKVPGAVSADVLLNMINDISG
jgi:protein-disulfide isomerase